ncbi:CatB-related O-acetyltransferase [Melissococcus plutonius]|uniref:Chloramphenicol acetyltransferase n=2 Tax=Melissococcus plutonius TaxID=33970 RepID=F3Y7T6_MELPT|nr:CatB-related O-acetyltransferase [Melissococcus plutonius]BAL61369.1 chloramphenicol acetyltransferase [Melissococcus plutonius DAT561]KMT30571.1 chloramphenicol acetyltransferase [Melissococcus plutonius]KMT35816.1 chloramphenicol acetyltransferase [Melissococcus plutonius]KMT40935.1 chloramphenicol acetyltransferase [Melissococcus plutonius]MBB5177732.1 chloramphenicol O-acetyltransferase type B [Melissococcus plutonius]
MNNKQNFEKWSDILYLKDLVTNPLIEVGDFSYYSGYYSDQPFENGCVRYLWGDPLTKAAFNPTVEFGWQLDKLIIGNYVCIASGVTILMGGNHNHHPDWITVYPFTSHIKNSYEPKGNTVIKSDAWIGMNAMIMPGVTIGEGAIVAAGSMVVKDVAPYTIVGGNPAKVIKQRFTDDEIHMLLELRWFDWTEAQIDAAKDILMGGTIDDLYHYYKRNILN